MCTTEPMMDQSVRKSRSANLIKIIFLSFQPCACRACRTQADLERAEEEEEEENLEIEVESGTRKRTRETRKSSSTSATTSPAKTAKTAAAAVKPQLAKPISRSSILEKMQSNFNAFKPFSKGMCALDSKTDQEFQSEILITETVMPYVAYNK